MSPAENICKRFGPRSGPTSGSTLFHTLIVFLKEILENVNFENSQQTTIEALKIIQHAKSYFLQFFSHIMTISYSTVTGQGCHKQFTSA